MSQPIMQIKVLSSEEKSFTNEKGENISYIMVTGITHDNEIFIFNDYKNKPELNSIYDMFIEHDSKLRAKVIYRLSK